MSRNASTDKVEDFQRCFRGISRDLGTDLERHRLSVNRVAIVDAITRGAHKMVIASHSLRIAEVLVGVYDAAENTNERIAVCDALCRFKAFVWSEYKLHVMEDKVFRRIETMDLKDRTAGDRSFPTPAKKRRDHRVAV